MKYDSLLPKEGVIHVWDSKTGHLVSAVTSGASSGVLEIHWVAEKNLYLSVHEKEVRFWKVGVISLQQLQEIDAELKGLYHYHSNHQTSPRHDQGGYTPLPQEEPAPEKQPEETKPTPTEKPVSEEQKPIQLKPKSGSEESDTESEDS